MKSYRIGVLTYQTGKDRYSQMSYIAALTKAAQNYPVELFAFGVDDVDHKKERIRALCYDLKQKKWERRWVFFPHLVYDHVRYHPTKQFKRYVEFRKSGIIPFSYHGYSHKLGVMEYLSSLPELNEYIPETIPLTRIEEIPRFLKRGPSILKPINGTGGRDIFALEKKGNRYLLSGRTREGRWLDHKIVGMEELRQVILPHLNRERYLIQRKIPIEYGGKTCDTRVLVQKDGKGEWSFTGMGTRIGKSHRVVSNLAKGANAIRSEEFVRSYLHRDPEPILQKIRKISLLIAKKLEERYGSFVEFGLDLGILSDGSFRLIEANSKPDRKIFLRTGQREAYQEAVRKPIEYHLFLCRKIVGV
ncbi:conserved hypothetical protein [[Clostridium] ultunense Esp]|uniref:YheC/YheD family endospore coat-associated protein n=1 Tax=Thermicanus aegyptius TaxID=94009 RepID=UPI0002B70957|nr:YheC/YheD family protein [Thermicanus aegyptius]CCQ97728.1 conserved hypothetical protein [[Clostridium] ultunense Esp]